VLSPCPCPCWGTTT